MKSAELKEYPLIGEVLGDGSCPYLCCTCSTCMYRAEADDAEKTGDERSRCLYERRQHED